jgi:hypothetical protein
VVLSLGLDGCVPDHSTFSKTRHGRFRGSDAFRHLFEIVVQRAIAGGLVGGEGFAVDASLIEADVNKQRSVASTDDVDWPELARTRRSVREYLDTLDEAAWGAASEVVPKFISPSDPAAQWTGGAHKRHTFFAYSNNYLIDLKTAIIVDVEATRANRRAEVGAAKIMIDRAEVCFGLKPQRLSADAAYGSAEILDWIVREKQIAPHVPVLDKDERTDGTFRRSDFVFDAISNTYTCPGGKILQQYRRPYTIPRGGVTKDNTRLYRASQADCAACALKPRCCPGQRCCRVARSVHEAARDVARRLATTPEYLPSRCDRKKVEMLFAHLKRILRLNQLSTARSVRRQGRVPARRDRAEPTQAGQASRTAASVRHPHGSIARKKPNGRSANRW